MSIYEALGVELQGDHIAVKLSTGEPPASNYLDPNLIAGVVHLVDGTILYINVMKRLSIDCDCDGNPSEPDMHDIGILASADPVALDQACVDLVYASSDNNTSLVQRMESRNAFNVLIHGEKIGLGSRAYRLENMDD